MLAREPKWAELKEQNEEDGSDQSSAEEDDAELTTKQTTNGLIRFAGKFIAKSKALPAKHLDFKLLKDPTIGQQMV